MRRTAAPRWGEGSVAAPLLLLAPAGMGMRRHDGGQKGVAASCSSRRRPPGSPPPVAAAFLIRCRLLPPACRPPRSRLVHSNEGIGEERMHGLG